MRPAWSIVALLLTVGLAACEADPDAPLAASDPTALSDDEAVRVAASGATSVILGCSHGCMTRDGFWVDLSVRNDAYAKEVAIVWSSDGWATQQTAAARFERGLPDGREQWGVDVTLGEFWPWNPPPAEVVYAVYVRMAGQTYWDRHNDHYVHQPVEASRPVRLLGSRVTYEAGTGAVLSGTVRVYDLAPAKQVTVRYSTDGWQSFHDADATWTRDDDWSFRIAGLGTDTLPDAVELAVRYRVAGADEREHWDSAGGANYRHRLRPALTLHLPVGVAGRPVSGVVDASAQALTDLAVARLVLRVDDGPWSDGPSARFSTAGLAAGVHTLTARVELEGGFVAESSTDLVVENRLRPLGVWRPSLPALGEGRGSSWGLALGADGRVYQQWEAPWTAEQPTVHTVLRHEAFGASFAPLMYEAIPAGPSGWPASVWDITVDEGGRVFGLENGYPGVALWRWDADGHLDAGFGAGGRLELPVAVVGFDVGRALAAGDGAVWLVGTCPGWSASCEPHVTRVSEDGALVDRVDLPPDVTTDERSYPMDPGAATFSDGALWVLRGRTITRVAPDVEGRMAVAGVIEFGDGLDLLPYGLARTPAGRFFVLSGQTLHAFAADGAFEGAWVMGGADELAGGNSLPRTLVALPDGSVGVLDVSGASVVRFAGPVDDVVP